MYARKRITGAKKRKSSGDIVGALMERPAAKYCGFAETIGKFVIYYRRAIDNRPYIPYRYILKKGVCYVDL